MDSVEVQQPGQSQQEQRQHLLRDIRTVIEEHISSLSSSQLQDFLTSIDAVPRDEGTEWYKTRGHMGLVLVEQCKMKVRERIAQEKQKQQGSSSPLEGIDLIHRGNDGYICFANKDSNDDWKQPFSVKASELKQYIPQLIEHVLGPNWYFSLNAMYRPKQWCQSTLIPSLKEGDRGANLLRHITGCWVDCDVRGMEDQDDQLMSALSTMLDARKRGINIPPWSMMIHSGQGFWLLWLLKEEDNTPGTGKPIRTKNWGKLEAAWDRCQRQLVRAFEPLKADKGAIDLARVARVPGSTNSKNGNKVVFRPNLGDDYRIVAYSLDELCAMLKVEPAIVPKGARKVDPKRSEQSRIKKRTMLEKRLNQLRQLGTMRGGYKEGTRSNALWAVGATLRQMRVDESEALGILNRFNEALCDPPQPSKEVKQGYTGAKRTLRIKNDTLGDRLQVTREEARATGLPYAGFVPDPSLKGNSRAVAKNRRELLERNVREAGGEVLTARQHQERLDKLGYTGVSLRTIQLDLKQLGLK